MGIKVPHNDVNNIVTSTLYLLYLLGPSSRQKVSVNVASSSKNSVANASHHKLSLSCGEETNSGTTAAVLAYKDHFVYNMRGG